jgi:hypothetical protein
MRGGKREGSGRPKSEPTTNITFRVNAAKSAEIREKIKELLKSMK